MRILLLLWFLLPLSAFAEEKPAVLTVHGEAVTKVAPDQVTLPVTVREENADVKVAKQKHDDKLRALLGLAQKTGIEKDHIETNYTSVEPVYDYLPSAKPKLRGYRVETMLGFKLDDISKLGEFMNDVIDLGITELGSVSYSLKDEKKVEEDTLVKSLENANEKATLLAATAKVAVDKQIDIEEGSPDINYPRPPRPMRFAMAAASMSAMAPAPPELPEGLIEIHQSVTVTYQLK